MKVSDKTELYLFIATVRPKAIWRITQSNFLRIFLPFIYWFIASAQCSMLLDVLITLYNSFVQPLTTR